MKKMLIITVLFISTLVPTYVYGHNKYPKTIQTVPLNVNRGHHSYSRFVQKRIIESISILFMQPSDVSGVKMYRRDIKIHDKKSSPILAFFIGIGERSQFTYTSESRVPCRARDGKGK